VSVSGFLLRGPKASWGGAANGPFTEDPGYPLDTPILHLIGQTDVVVTRERSDIIISSSTIKRVEEHVGGVYP
jgi:hypothetical protein